VTLAWFDKNLKGKSAPTLSDLAARYQEIEILK
jgi:hypothetical protein